jgi:hypothetical protein
VPSALLGPVKLGPHRALKGRPLYWNVGSGHLAKVSYGAVVFRAAVMSSIAACSGSLTT